MITWRSLATLNNELGQCNVSSDSKGAESWRGGGRNAPRVFPGVIHCLKNVWTPGNNVWRIPRNCPPYAPEFFADCKMTEACWTVFKWPIILIRVVSGWERQAPHLRAYPRQSVYRQAVSCNIFVVGISDVVPSGMLEWEDFLGGIFIPIYFSLGVHVCVCACRRGPGIDVKYLLITFHFILNCTWNFLILAIFVRFLASWIPYCSVKSNWF